MLDDDVVALWSRVRMLERRWWSRARRDPQLVRFCAEQGLMPENMMVHGEVLFCLAGLKPAVIVTGLPPAMMEEFVGSVLLAAGLNGFLAGKSCSIAVQQIRTLSTVLFDFAGCWAVVNTQHASASLTCRLFTGDTITEPEIASILDYPVCITSLASPGTAALIEVAYVDSSTGELLTSYVTSANLQASTIAHFNRYRSALRPTLALHLHMSSPRSSSPTRRP
ncbi:hypothetical protein PBRA_008292 [Plasmodiophora brassicae]|uniref:Uncharacterized protein n=1 Tax=Plasmodiophora brassicae TaxID=37360 RepID=A0A0G4J069_PLABS|nr:hypothetical protein PBRA_008292 [Plasmodiophora brassicae]